MLASSASNLLPCPLPRRLHYFSSNSIAEFEEIVNARYKEEDLKEGYAPFCKHIFLQNDFTQAKVNVLKITPQNEGLLRSSYEARNEKELPVLQRYFPSSLIQEEDLPVAKYLDLILYSRDQINKVRAGLILVLKLYILSS